MNDTVISEAEEREWVQMHLVVLALIVGIGLGAVILDSQVGKCRSSVHRGSA
jgi:hypothetical protein